MKIAIGLAALIVAGLLYANFGNQPAPIPQSMQAYQLLQHGPYKVRAEKLELSDERRSIPANGDYAGNPVRQFDLYLWTPANRPAQAMPLVVYSHGFMSTGLGGRYLGEYLASHGYTVASATYPLTHYGAPGGPFVGDVVNQPGDVSFIIDTLLQRNSDAADRLYQTIDPARVAAAGLSLGGLTTKLAAFHPRNADKRIATAISIAGPSYPFAKRFYSERTIPFMMIATPQDAMVSYEDNAANMLDKVSGAILVTIDGASHAGFSAMARWLRWFDNPDSLGCDALMKNVDLEADISWYDLLGGPEIGVNPAEAPAMCDMDPLPAAMNPLRQHQLTTLAVGSFLNCHFLLDDQAASENCRYLRDTLAREFQEVSVRAG
ncbi:MAG: hypothetical protein KJO62_08495 [Gammaproteobacteria bacterium]|nr:hypothetical protein [Gammaproteobacteria bacterium]